MSGNELIVIAIDRNIVKRFLNKNIDCDQTLLFCDRLSFQLASLSMKLN